MKSIKFVLLVMLSSVYNMYSSEYDRGVDTLISDQLEQQLDNQIDAIIARVLDQALHDELAQASFSQKFDKTISTAGTKVILSDRDVPDVFIASTTIENARGSNRTPRYNNQDRAFSVVVKPAIKSNAAIIAIGVCDGHGDKGDIISNYARKQIITLLEEKLKNYDTLKELNESKILNSLGKDIQRNIEITYPDILDSGSTISFTLIQKTPDNKYSLILFNMGDSRILLFNTQSEKSVSTLDHKASNKKEQERIKKAGGVIEQRNSTMYATHNDAVVEKNVDGNQITLRRLVSPTRGVGDIVLSNYNVVSNDPDVFFIESKSKNVIGDMYIVVATDGLWEVMSDKQVMEFIKERDNKPEWKLQNICHELAKNARIIGSLDDITVNIVKI